jgi:glutamate synthase (NADPH/NADH) small chain
MGKPTGFLEWQRVVPTKRPVDERLRDHGELAPPLSPRQAHEQAGRCMDCGVPFCHQGCPLGNVVPDFAEHVYRADWEAAYRVLASTNDFPEVTGRVCPAPCESACVLGLEGRAVSIESLEHTIAERAFDEGWVEPPRAGAPTGKRVAIVGSGPAGLAAAFQLVRAGHTVTVLEQDDRLGGLLRYGIPDFKLDKGVLERRIALLERAGARLVTGARVGESPTFDQLAQEHDAVLLALGARRPRTLDVPGSELSGVLQAMDYLERQNRAVARGERVSEPFDARGRRVVILGGGDTGSDCLGTALRQGAMAVQQIELLPAPPSERARGNPWPTWPVVLRTSSSQEEGGERLFALRTLRLEGEHGRLRRLVGERVTVEGQAGSASSRGGPPRLVPTGEPEVVLEVELLLLAMGFVGPDTSGLSELGVALDARGNVRADASYRTSVANVWCAGDAMRGASLVVTALADGREAARSIDAALRAGKSVLATRGRDVAFT